MPLQFLLCMNLQGKPRLMKHFNLTTPPLSHSSKHQLQVEIYRLLSSREHKQHSNFIEWKDLKIIYKRYAGLYFICAIDLDGSQDEELIYLSTIHLLVEILDEVFENVCELDLIFGGEKCYAVIDEVFSAGEVMECSKAKVLQRVKEIELLD
ncbi:hypothetical protein WICPIJ_007290 [Wickerhamomyces pijperi]|uniref:AP complex subunit sigma n=1 Tax=Wickerhamomyces pijperi TaxID=599730 RepID=A0A9P8Q215_WICPI|nr:hypothetical protein WICPIJ_007290 [Wickerhamomyces pijperi]